MSLSTRGMQGQQLFKSVRSKRAGRSFRITIDRSVATSHPLFPTHSDTRFSVRSTENSQGKTGSNRSQPINLREKNDDFQVDKYIPATRPGQESEPTTGQTDLLRWVAYMVGILLFVGGISLILF